MRVRRFAVPLVVVLLAVLGGPAAEARTDNRSKPIVYIHGFDPIFSSGYDCHSYWDVMADRLEGWGHTGTRATTAYYWFDTNCTYDSQHHGSHSAHYAGGHYLGGHTRDTSIRHLAYHTAWMIYDHFTAGGVTVDAVGHSMGGLILRYAIAQVQRRDPAFPPTLNVEDAVTLGTPHTGTGWAWGCGYAECVEMRPGSSFLSWLATNAPNPQGTGGTDWTVVGSEDDGIVSADSGVGMSAAHKVIYYWWMGIDHVDYIVDTSDARDADVRYQNNGGAWTVWYNAPHVVRWSDFAFVYGSW